MTLELILEKMLEAVQNGDWEGAHSNADSLLIDTLRVLAPTNETVKEIVEAWSAVGKWYA